MESLLILLLKALDYFNLFLPHLKMALILLLLKMDSSLLHLKMALTLPHLKMALILRLKMAQTPLSQVLSLLQVRIAPTGK